MSTDVSVVWLKELDEFGIFIVLDVTALAFAPVINMRKAGPWETDWLVISSKRSQRAQPACLLSVVL